MKPIENFVENSTLAYRGVRFDVRSCELHTAKGRTKLFEAIIHPGAAVILPLFDPNSVVMIRNYRIAVGEEIWELPAGTLELGEDPKATAARELIEETGYQADSIELLTTFYTSPGISNEVMHAYTAKGLHFVGQKLDDSEMIAVEVLPWTTILDMVGQGEIRDAKTLVTLLFYAMFKLS